MRASIAPLLTPLLAICIGCAGPSDSGERDDTEEPPCGGEVVDHYTPGIEKMGDQGKLTFAVAEATPDPPDEGDNTWVLLLSQGGAPLDGAAVIIEPTMPAHGHGTSPATFQGAGQGGGHYQVGPFDLIMPGVWRFDVAASGPAADEATFTFCVEG